MDFVAWLVLLASNLNGGTIRTRKLRNRSSRLSKACRRSLIPTFDSAQIPDRPSGTRAKKNQKEKGQCSQNRAPCRWPSCRQWHSFCCGTRWFYKRSTRPTHLCSSATESLPGSCNVFCERRKHGSRPWNSNRFPGCQIVDFIQGKTKTGDFSHQNREETWPRQEFDTHNFGKHPLLVELLCHLHFCSQKCKDRRTERGLQMSK